MSVHNGLSKVSCLFPRKTKVQTPGYFTLTWKVSGRWAICSIAVDSSIIVVVDLEGHVRRAKLGWNSRMKGVCTVKKSAYS